MPELMSVLAWGQWTGATASDGLSIGAVPWGLYQVTPRMGVVGGHSRHRSTVLGMLQLPGSDFTPSSLPPGSPGTWGVGGVPEL